MFDLSVRLHALASVSPNPNAGEILSLFSELGAVFRQLGEVGVLGVRAPGMHRGGVCGNDTWGGMLWRWMDA